MSSLNRKTPCIRSRRLEEFLTHCYTPYVYLFWLIDFVLITFSLLTLLERKRKREFNRNTITISLVGKFSEFYMFKKTMWIIRLRSDLLEILYSSLSVFSWVSIMFAASVNAHKKVLFLSIKHAVKHEEVMHYWFLILPNIHQTARAHDVYEKNGRQSHIDTRETEIIRFG